MTTERFRDNIEALKKRGGDQKAEIIRDIFRGYPDEEEGPIPLADVQSYAYDKMQQGAYPKTTLANTRRSLYDSDSGSYGFFTWSKKGVKNYLEMTELGREFNSWLFTPERSSWGKPGVKANRKNEEKPYFEGGVVNTHLPTEPIVMDNVSANQHGLLVAYVPAGVDIVWVEEIEQEDGSVKKKPHKIKRKSEEKVLSPEEAQILELKARLRELGEDI